MKFSHCEEQRDDRHLDILIDEENGLRIIVSRLGAELISLARVNEVGAWTGFLYRDNDLSVPSQGWANHATVMGYYLHRLKNGRSLYRAREIKGGNHGFLRSKMWHLVGSTIELRLPSKPFVCKCRRVVTAGIFHRETISLAKPETSIFRAGKCRFQKVSCQDRASSSLSMCRCVNFATSIHQADAG